MCARGGCIRIEKVDVDFLQCNYSIGCCYETFNRAKSGHSLCLSSQQGIEPYIKFYLDTTCS